MCNFFVNVSVVRKGVVSNVAQIFKLIKQPGQMRTDDVKGWIDSSVVVVVVVAAAAAAAAVVVICITF